MKKPTIRKASPLKADVLLQQQPIRIEYCLSMYCSMYSNLRGYSCIIKDFVLLVFSSN